MSTVLAVAGAPPLLRRTRALLFACNYNSVRSPMAAAIARRLLPKDVYVASAGVRRGELDPFAVAAMEEIGLDLSRHRPLTFEDLEDGFFDLVVTLDDATGCITSALLVEEEGTQSSFAGLFETIAAQGLFGALYTDRGSHYFHTPEAGGKVDKTRPTQVGRALAQLGIRHIPSYSPQARGRMERVFGTLQQRLPPELRAMIR